MIDRYPVPDFLHRQPAQPAGTRERPILFSDPMVLALLADTKTQTRRVCKPAEAASLSFVAGPFEHDERVLKLWGDEDGFVRFDCPYGEVGDRLWVREKWGACDYFNNTAPRDLPHFAAIKYFADGSIVGATAGYGLIRKARPSIHMPRQFSRILLEVVAVRVERLQDISDDDCMAEGIQRVPVGKLITFTVPGTDVEKLGARAAYEALWVSINGRESWDANPFVWAVEFKRVTP